VKAARELFEPVGRTVAEARRAFAARLRENGFETPDLDARVLVGHVLGLDHAALASAAARIVGADEAAQLTWVEGRRLRNEPVALIVGEKEFWGLALEVTPATLIPRPETETVVETALRLLVGARRQPLRIADLGTGSGAILLALLSELPAAFGIGADISLAALAVARSNAARLKLAPRTAFVAGDFAAQLGGGFDIVASNPPYIATSEIARLAPGVRDFEPHGALDGGADGLRAYRAIAADAARLLAPGGHAVVEIGIGQEPAVRGLFEDQGLRWAVTTADIAGIPRAMAFKRP
jgi:release factor glutamine methyltransferase